MSASVQGNGMSEQLGAIKLEDRVKTKSKNLDVAAEFKNSNQKPAANFVVIGKKFKHVEYSC